MNESLYTVGKVVNTHGIRGEIKVVSQTDFPDVRFARGSALVLVDPGSNVKLQVTVESAHLHKNVYIVKLREYDNINDVEKYKGWTLKVTAEHLVDLPEGEYYYYEIIGCRVVTEDGETIGTIKEILSPGANDVWVVERPSGKDALIPYIDDVVLNVNVDEKLVTVHLMEGLLD